MSSIKKTKKTQVKIVVVQFKIAQLDPEKNLKRIEKFIEKAKKQKAEIIIFPEDCVTGALEDEATGQKAGYKKWLDKNHSVKKVFQALAIKYQINIVTGSTTELVRGKIFNTSYFINHLGQVLGCYHKNHLYKSELSFITPGEKTVVFSTPWGKAGIIICWDITFSEIFQRLVRAGVKIIFCPSYWWRGISEDTEKLNPREQEEEIDAMCVTRAFENEVVFVYANAAGTAVYQNHTKDILIGHSQITMPILGVVKKLNHNREKMFLAEIDLSLLNQAEKIYQKRSRKK